MAESGVPDFDLNSWNGYFGPAGLPPEVVARLNAAINQVVARPETRQRLAALLRLRRARRRTSPASWASSATCGAS